jgi:outer membrane protein TolC
LHNLLAAFLVLWLSGTAAALPEPAIPEGPLTLEQCVDIALANHSRVMIADESVASARQGLRRSRSSYYPDIGTQWQYTSSESRGGRRFTDIGGLPVEVGSTAVEQHQTNVYANYNLWNSGTREANLRISKSTLSAQLADLEATRRDLELQVTTDYYDSLRSGRSLAIAREALDLAQGNLDAAEARITAGAAAETDRYPLRSALYRARLDVVTAENADRLAATKLRNSLGLGLGPALPLVEPQAPVFGDYDLAGLLDSARHHRPELVAAQADVDAAGQRLRLARIARDPYLSVDGRYNYKPEPSPWGTDWTISASVALPLFDAGDLAAQERSAEAALRQAQLRYDQTDKDIAAEVESAYTGVVSAKPGYEAATAGEGEAKANLDVATAKYRLEMAIPLEVVDAQARYSSARLSAAKALYDYHVALGQLKRAVGGRLPTGGS